MLRDSEHHVTVEADPSGWRLGERTTLSKMRACKACISRRLHEGVEKIQPGLLTPVNMFYRITWFLNTHFQQDFFLHPNGKSLLSPASERQLDPWQQAEVGSSGHTWRLLRKPQESALSPLPIPALAGFLHSAWVTLGVLGLCEKLLGRLTSTWGSLLLSLCMPLKCYLWSLLTPPPPPVAFHLSLKSPSFSRGSVLTVINTGFLSHYWVRGKTECVFCRRSVLLFKADLPVRWRDVY